MKTKKYFALKIHIVLFLGLVCTFHGLSAKAAGLFTGVTGASADFAAKVDSDILKRRVVRINFKELAQQIGKEGKIQINLFDDLSFDGIINKTEDLAAKNYVLSGHLNGDEFSSFALSVKGDIFVMNLRTKTGEFYQVRYLGNGLHEVRQMNESKFPPCGTKAAHMIAAKPGAQIAADLPQGDAADFIDVMVVYTSTARRAALPNGTPQQQTINMQALISLAVTESNLAYQHSLITPRIRLVYQGEISYVESGDFDTDLNRLTNPSDGYMDEVQGLRNSYGADLVSLWIDNSQYCGLGWLMTTLSPSFENHGFSAVFWDCATGYYSFSHEMGHNMGCQHDRENAGGAGLYPYSYGWRFTTAGNVTNRTIMAYSPGTRIQYFSNPNVSFNGVATGVAAGANQSYNAQTINNSASTIANFRQTITATNIGPTIYGQPQSQNANPGDTVTFIVAAGGSATRTYYWRKGVTGVAVTTNNSYIISNVLPGDSGVYSVMVSNAFGTATSSNATLAVSLAITNQPQSQSVPLGGTATFTVSATGLAPFYYQWQKGVATISGATASSYSITNVQSTNVGSYSVVVSNAYGFATSSNADLSILIPLGEAVDNAGFNWSTVGSNAVWFGQSAVSHDGIDAAQSGHISDDGYSILQTIITGPGTLTFWWKVSSEETYDWLDVFLDETYLDPNGISGEIDWTFRTFSIPAGNHALQWQYLKDESDIDEVGQDSAWVDQVSYVGTSPVTADSFGITNSQFKFKFTGLVGASYTIQTSTNLTNWADLTNLLISSSINLFIDPSSSNLNQRFYRIKSP